jgi:hypothetical protein
MSTRARSLVLLLTLAARASAQAAAAGDGDPAALAQMPVQPAAKEGIRVQIRGPGGQPVGQPLRGAVLATLPGSINAVWRARIREAELAFPGDPVRQTSSLLLRYGTRYAVDARGEATVPAAAPLTLFTFADDAWATALCRQADRPVTLTPAPPRRVPVVVVDGDGRPAAGVAVGIASGANAPLRTFARTGNDGAATIAWSALDEQLDGQLDAPCVRLLAALREPVQQPLPASPDTPAQLRLPPTGSVRVLLQGRASASSPRVALRVAAKGGVLVPPADADPLGARFPFVEPGARVAAEVAYEGLAAPIDVDVPAVAAGKETQLAIDLDAGPQRLAFRLRDCDGRPLARCELHVVWQQEKQSHGFDAVTGKGGEFELAVDPACVPGGSLTIEQRRDDGDWVASLQVSLQDLGPGRNDRGEVRMQEKPVLARGRVVDVREQPVAGVVVETTGGNRAAPTGRDGAFTLRARAPLPAQEELRLVDDRWFFATAPDRPVVVEGGNADCVLRIAPAARLLVRLSPPVDCTCGSAFGVEAVEQNTGAKYSTSFAAANPRLVLPAGRWRLTLSLEGEDVATFADVYADAGVEGHDARLLALDWRSFGELATIHVADPAGKPTDACEVRTFFMLNGRRANNARRPQGGALSLLLPKTGIETMVQPDDRLLNQIDLGVMTGGGHDVQFARPPRLTLDLSKVPAIVNGFSMEATLQRNGDDNVVRRPVGADGKVSLALAPGSWTLFLSLRVGNRAAQLATPMAIEVGQGDSTKAIEWTADLQREFDAALQSVFQRRQ